MRLENDKVILRDMIPSDVEDRVYWQTVETEWMGWDAPWESDPYSLHYKPFDELVYRSVCAEKLSQPVDEAQKRMSFQICANDADETHIGWCNCYFIDENYRFAADGRHHTIGIDIPVCSARRKGYASAAWTLFIEYLFGQGAKDIYTQTWSGNERVLGLIHKLCFQEVDRAYRSRYVNGAFFDALTFRLDKRAYFVAARNRNEK